jgi:hypothetical protein
LVILGGLLESVPVDIGHEGIEEDQVDRQEDLHCCNRWIKIGTYLPLGEDGEEGGVVFEEALKVVFDLVGCDVEGVDVL